MDFKLCWASLCLLLFSGAGSEPSPTLRQAADHLHVLIGTAVRTSQLLEAAYTETLGREFNLIEPEDAMKWSIIRRNESEFDFRDGDQVVRFAQAHGMKVRGTCLVWDHDHPAWLSSSQFTQAELSQLLKAHIFTVMKHYSGRVFAWDVVNEALDKDGNTKDSIWYNRPGIGFSGRGTAYIEQAFRWAHEADPQALLFYNEAEGEGMNRKSDAIYAMLKDFKRRGVPIDGVGLQMHVEKLDFDASAFSANITRLTALGLQVHITELDISLPLDAAGLVRGEDLQRQAELYRDVVRVCLRSPGCTAIQTWGFTDKYSWIGSHSRGTRGAALLFDRTYRRKPAYEAMLAELAIRHD